MFILVDNIFTTNLSSDLSAYILDMHISDHQPIILFTSDDLPPTRAKYLTIRTNTDDRKDHFKQFIQYKHVFDQLDTNIHIPDLNYNYEILEHSLKETHSECFPERRDRFNDKKHKKSSYLTNDIRCNFAFRLIDNNATMRIIKNSKISTSKGHDGISSELLKLITNGISKCITVIINQSLTSGIFPNSLKLAKVTPIFKKENNKLITNYRPISVLPVISKIFGTVIHEQLSEYFISKSNNMLNTLPHYFDNFLPEFGIHNHTLRNDLMRPPAMRCEFG